MSKLTLILISVILLLSTLMGIGAYYHKSKVSSLQHDNYILTWQTTWQQEEVARLNSLRESEEKILEATREELAKIKVKSSNQIQEVKDVYKNENIVDSALPSSLIRVLDDACKSANGSSCSNP